MNKIRFSHIYHKMPSVFWSLTEADTWLIGVSRCDVKDLPEKFIEYDTSYDDNGHTSYYELPKGEVIVLTLMTKDIDISENCLSIWTTVRRFTPEKYNYYLKCVGNQVEIVIEEET